MTTPAPPSPVALHNSNESTAPPVSNESLIDFPCLFPLKVMGENEPNFVHALTHIAKTFDPQFNASTIKLRDSKNGKYLGVTLHVNVNSQPQLDELYRTLSTHPMVKVVL